MPGKKSGHGDLLSEEMIDHGKDLKVDPRSRFFYDVGNTKHRLISQRTAYGAYPVGSVKGRAVFLKVILHRFRNFGDQKTRHAHAVFKLDIAVIGLFGRERQSRIDVPLIRGMREMIAETFLCDCLVLLDDGDDFLRILSVKRL